MFLERDNVSSYCERSVFGSDFGLLDYDGVVSGRDEAMSGRDEAMSGRDEEMSGSDEAMSGRDHARASPANALQYQCLQDCGFFEGAHGGQVSRQTSNGLRPQAGPPAWSLRLDKRARWSDRQNSTGERRMPYMGPWGFRGGEVSTPPS